jgi:hypothetical protein
MAKGDSGSAAAPWKSRRTLVNTDASWPRLAEADARAGFDAVFVEDLHDGIVGDGEIAVKSKE